MLMARCGTASLVRARRGMAVEASSDMVCQGGAGFGWAVQFGRDQAGSGTAGRGGLGAVR